ncbi:MAG: HD domain-containing protein [Aquificota bacterium]|nr:HD domain-containing protein [Aquificota bacterium]
MKEEIEDTIEDFFDLSAVHRIYLRKKTFNFIDLVGQLRFQKRWILSPRIPLTTVLGHMFIVASLSYLLSLKIGACPRRRFLNFFTGLFHDLPEVTTRDVV